MTTNNISIHPQPGKMLFVECHNCGDSRFTTENGIDHWIEHHDCRMVNINGISINLHGNTNYTVEEEMTMLTLGNLTCGHCGHQQRVIAPFKTFEEHYAIFHHVGQQHHCY